MKTVSENANKTNADKMSNKKGARKFLQTLQPSGGDKENLVGTGRLLEKNSGPKVSKPKAQTEIGEKPLENKSVIAKVNPSLYKKLIIEDLTSTAGPSERYWEVIAERRRKALEDLLEQNRKLHDVVIALEEENASCKVLLEHTTELVNTLKEMINEEKTDSADEDEINYKSSPSDSGQQKSHSKDSSNEIE